MNRYDFLVICVVLLTPSRKSTAAPPKKIVPPGVNYPRSPLVTGYRVDPTWPRRAAHPWQAMPGIAVDKSGNIWTVNRGKVPVQVFDPSGRLIRQWGTDYFASPHQISIGPKGHIWIPDSHHHVVHKFTPQGKKLLTIGQPGKPGNDLKRLKMPTDVVELPNGNIFISDGYRNNRIVHCDATGKIVKTWGGLGVAPGKFSLPHSIAADSKGRLYVADRNNGRIQVFTQGGRFLAQWKLCVPWTIRITARDEVYVVGTAPAHWRDSEVQLTIAPKDQLMMKFDTKGRLQHWWSFRVGNGTNSKPGELAWVHGLAVDAKGNLYLGDIMGQRAQKFRVIHAKK